MGEVIEEKGSCGKSPGVAIGTRKNCSTEDMNSFSVITPEVTVSFHERLHCCHRVDRSSPRPSSEMAPLSIKKKEWPSRKIYLLTSDHRNIL